MTTHMEWTVCQDEREWEVLRSAQQPGRPAVPARRTAGRGGASAGVRTRWRRSSCRCLSLPITFCASSRDDGSRRERGARCGRRRSLSHQQPQHGRHTAHSRPSLTWKACRSRNWSCASVEIRGDYALVEAWVTAPPIFPGCRLTAVRFYRETELGWLPTSPPEVFWQPQVTLHAGRFTFVAGRRDAVPCWLSRAQIEPVQTSRRDSWGCRLQMNH